METSRPELAPSAKTQENNAKSSLIARFAEQIRPALQWSPVRRTRRNHALEHATIHVLSGRMAQLRVGGRSDHHGFVLLGDIPTDAIESAVEEALRRLRRGDRNLAVHPNCGTNLVTTGFLTSCVAILGTWGTNHKNVWSRMPFLMSALMFTILYSQPLGMSLQRHITTEGDPGDLELVRVTPVKMQIPLGGSLPIHRVETRCG